MANTQTVEESLLHSVSRLVYHYNCYAVNWRFGYK